jgi:hypothetical protein
VSQNHHRCRSGFSYKPEITRIPRKTTGLAGRRLDPAPNVVTLREPALIPIRSGAMPPRSDQQATFDRETACYRELTRSSASTSPLVQRTLARGPLLRPRSRLGGPRRRRTAHQPSLRLGRAHRRGNDDCCTSGACLPLRYVNPLSDLTRCSGCQRQPLGPRLGRCAG